MEILTIVNIITAVIAASSIVLKVVAPLTKNKKDDAVSRFLTKILEMISLNTNTKPKEVWEK
jgi:hypothetical protein